MREVELIGIKEIMELTGVGRPLAEKYARDCGLAKPRVKGGAWKIPKSAFIRWIEGGKG